MRRPLVLIGAGGLGRETAELVRAIDHAAPTWELIGFVDDDPRTVGTTVQELPVLGPPSLAHELDADVAVTIATSNDPGARRRLVARLTLEPNRYATLVHPWTVIAGSASLGPGTILHATTVLTADVVVGTHVVAMPGVVLTHDNEVGDGATLAAGVRLGGGVRVGADAYLGAGVVVREGLTIGRGAVVGMGAVVTHSVPAGEVWVGSPAHPLEVSR